jgi:transcriptional regulator with XRE-family HTH domain
MRARPRGLTNRITRLAYLAALRDDELARRAGVSRAQLNRIRNGRAVPRVTSALALAAVLGRRVCEVFQLDTGRRAADGLVERRSCPPPAVRPEAPRGGHGEGHVRGASCPATPAPVRSPRR